ncbi:MAG: hypothetical protein ACE5F1_09740 [Planctomycetota bacterium]
MNLPRLSLSPVLFLCAGSSASWAQNLAPNPSFELKTSCPTTSDQMSRCVAWSKPTNATTDYMNACHTLGIVGVPTNVFGTQPARTGQAYAHIYTAVKTSDYREYVQAKLTSTLASGKKYEVSFWISLADGAKEATAEIGAYFSASAVGSTSSFHLPFVPQVENPSTSVITNKTGWVEIKGTFTAAGGEQYVTIGNFRDVANTTKINVSGGHQGADYYLDDVSVRPVAPGGGGAVATDHVIGWADLPSPALSSSIDLQDIDGGCKKAFRRCSTRTPVRAQAPYAGGTAYDPRYQTVWVSDGLVLAEYSVKPGIVRTCLPRCKPFKAIRVNPSAFVSGLACADRKPRLFQLATAPGYMEVTVYDNGGGCPGMSTTCKRNLPPKAVAGGLAYDEVRDLLYVSVSTPLSTGGWSTLLWVAAGATPCQISCERPLFNCSKNPVTGLAYDACKRKLYATDGQVTQTVVVVDPKTCSLKSGACCQKQITPVWRGLAVVPGWTKKSLGSSCTAKPCPSCPGMIASCAGDPGLGNTFRYSLKNAPAPSFAILVLKAGPCGPGFLLPPPLCGRWFLLPSLVSFPPHTLTGPGTCSGTAHQGLPIPADRRLCGIVLCAQWFVLCRGATGLGLGLSNAIESPVVGS